MWAELLAWLEKELRSMNFGELCVVIKVHDSMVTLVEKTKTERSKQ